MGIIILIAVVLVIVVGGAVILFSARRADSTGALSRETKARDSGAGPVAEEGGAEGSSTELAPRERAEEAGAGAVATRQGTAVTHYVAVDDDEIGITRRQFLNRSILIVLAVPVLGTLSLALVGFLWPTAKTGFGGNVKAGNLDDILDTIASDKKPYYVPEARAYVTPYPKEDLGKAVQAYGAPQVKLSGMEDGIVALYQRCVHLGCRVPFCQSSQWFECPCHGSKYSRVGEKKGGPAPRGLDRFPVEITSGTLTIVTNLSTLIQGPKPGTDTTGQGAEGPPCV